MKKSKQIEMLAAAREKFSALSKVEQFEGTGLAFVSPKSKKSRRKVEVGPMLGSLLAEWRRRQDNGSRFVFHDELGKPFDPGFVTKLLRKASKAVGINFLLHDMRHLHASLLVASGADVKRVQERLGHADVQTTLNIYSHVVNEDGRKYAAKAEAALAYVSEILAPSPSPALPN